MITMSFWMNSLWHAESAVFVSGVEKRVNAAGRRCSFYDSSIIHRSSMIHGPYLTKPCCMSLFYVATGSS